MKNIHILPTDKPSRLAYDFYEKFYLLSEDAQFFEFQNLVQNREVYITSDEKFVKDEYITDGIEVIKAFPKLVDAQGLVNRRNWRKIILTTDQDLIKDGVQAINDNFLEWFVKNPSCENVEIIKDRVFRLDEFNQREFYTQYKITIPKEEQKQHLIDMMEKDEELGLYDIENDWDKILEEYYDQPKLNFISLNKWLKENYEIPKKKMGTKQEIKLEDIFNDEKRQGVKELIDKHKQHCYCSDRLELDENERCVTQCDHCADIQPKYFYEKESPKQDDENYLDSFGVTKTQFEVYRNFNKQKTLEGLADKWVFETNGHKWSNNNNEAGDNFGSFIAGFKEAEKTLYSEEEAKKLVFDFYYDMSHKMGVPTNLISENATNVDVWFNQFKKK